MEGHKLHLPAELNELLDFSFPFIFSILLNSRKCMSIYLL